MEFIERVKHDISTLDRRTLELKNNQLYLKSKIDQPKEDETIGYIR